MSWDELLAETGLTEREVRSVMALSEKPKQRASDLAKSLGTTRLDAYNSLSRLQEMGIVTATADRPMRFSSMRVDQAVSHIIEMRSTQLDRLKSGFEEVSKNIKVSEKNNTSQQNSDEPRFAVLKGKSTHLSKT